MTLDADGNLGIGNTDPDAKLVVGSTSDSAINMDASASGHFKVSGATYSFAIANNDTGTFLYNNGSNRAMVFGVNETERMRIDSSGNVGISSLGTTPDTQLHLTHSNQTGSGKGIIRIQDVDSQQDADQLTGGLEFYTQDASVPTAGVSSWLRSHVSSTVGGSYVTIGTANNGSSNGTERLRIDSSGNVGIGTTNPPEKLFVNGNIFAYGPGIDFSASEGSGADGSGGSVLDDYEEGTFDPTVGGVDVGGGFYTKIGSLVFIEIVVTANSVSTNTIDGLPFSLTTASGYGGLTFGRVIEADVFDANGVPCRSSFVSTSINFYQNVTNASASAFTITTDSSGTVRLGITGWGSIT